MRFNYGNRPQSDGRIKCKKCSLPMLGIDEQDFRTWDPATILDKTFCDCKNESNLTPELIPSLTKEMIEEWMQDFRTRVLGHALLSALNCIEKKNEALKLYSKPDEEREYGYMLSFDDGEEAEKALSLKPDLSLEDYALVEMAKEAEKEE